MALIHCPECSSEISDRALACPQCGAPRQISAKKDIAITRTGGSLEALGFILIVGGMIFGMASDPDNHIGGIIGFLGFCIFIAGRFK